MARALGIGELLDPLARGATSRFKLDGGRAFRPSRILEIERRSPNLIRFETANHRYELRRIEGSTTRAGVLAVHDELGAKTAALEVGRDETSVVEITEWSESPNDGLGNGAHVSVTKVSKGAIQDLGPGILLVDLRLGEPASFALQPGVVGTSPILQIISRAKDRIELVTQNSVYHVELIPAQDSPEGSRP